MLWYKAWLETRSRFQISLLGIVALCCFQVFYEDKTATSFDKADYYDRVLGSGQMLLATMWVVAVTLLMMGGLLREKASGASSFTLALPVSRVRLTLVRVAMGMMQSAVLVIVPWSAMFLIASTVGKTHSVSLALFFIVLLLGGGSLYFAIALLISSVVEGEYTAPVVSYGIFIASLIILSGERLRPYNPWIFITGLGYLHWRPSLTIDPIPWLHMAVTLLIALSLVAISIKAIQRREF
jgi:ABC-type transport system involved in multi-copper enzyme maturation permease subunit